MTRAHPRRRGRVSAAGFGGLAVALCVWGCSREGAERVPSDPGLAARAQRFGVFRDLVWFPGPEQASGAPTVGGYFLDLFEASQADWRTWRAGRESPADTRRFIQRFTPGGRIDGALPIVGVDLTEARAYARWRFGRLPRREEWSWAATGGGVYALPWGDLPRVAYANSKELGAGRLAPVGTFESGRQRGRPFDLVGNASEWTETVLWNWSGTGSPEGEPAEDLDWRVDFAQRFWALRAYRPGPLGPLPQPVWTLACVEPDLPHFLTGGATRPANPRGGGGFGATDTLRPDERGSFVGIRVATDPKTLLRALARERELPPEPELGVLRAFVERNADVLRPVWRQVVGAGDDRSAPLVRSLDAWLGVGG